MAHFPIIELNAKKKTPEEIQNSSLDYESPLLNYFCDYFGGEYNADERKGVIESDRLKILFDGIADVNAEDESITFKSDKEIRSTLDRYFNTVLEELEEMSDKFGYQKFFVLRMKGNEYKDSSVIFYVDDCAFTSMQFIEDAYFYAGKTFYFGQIFDAHC